MKGKPSVKHKLQPRSYQRVKKTNTFHLYVSKPRRYSHSHLEISISNSKRSACSIFKKISIGGTVQWFANCNPTGVCRLCKVISKGEKKRGPAGPAILSSLAKRPYQSHWPMTGSGWRLSNDIPRKVDGKGA